MYTILLLLLLGLATHRATRFLTRDKLGIIAAPREVFTNRWATFDLNADGSKPNQKISVNGKPTNVVMRSLAYLWECDWCMSVWVGGILIFVTQSLISVPLPWLMWPAVSTITGLIAQRESD